MMERVLQGRLTLSLRASHPFSPKTQKSKLDIEENTDGLTIYSAGGGGKSETRRTKLKQKNEKLAEERAKNAQEEKKKKTGEKESKQGEDGGEYSGIHPSRLNQMR